MFAFVVERKNVNGAKSIVYAEDKETKIFEAVLKEGQGLLQADLHSSLWHEVTEISPLNPNEMAYRSSIGFDIEDGPSVIETISKNSTASLKFRAFYIDELDDFSQSGILFQVLKLLKKIISAFLVVSAFSRDYIFVQEADFEKTRLLLGI